MALERLDDFADVRLGLVVARAQCVDLVRALLKEPEQPLFFGGVEAAQLGDHVGYEPAYFAEVLGAHARKRCLREIGHFLLRASAVLQDGRRIAHVDLLRERVHHLLFVVGEHAVVKLRRALVRGGGRSGGLGN